MKIELFASYTSYVGSDTLIRTFEVLEKNCDPRYKTDANGWLEPPTPIALNTYKTPKVFKIPIESSLPDSCKEFRAYQIDVRLANPDEWKKASEISWFKVKAAEREIEIDISVASK